MTRHQPKKDWYERGRRLFCRKCKAVIHDRDEMDTYYDDEADGEFLHPLERVVGGQRVPSTCPNAGELFRWNRAEVDARMGGSIAKFYPKKHIRARRRGAKLANRLHRRAKASQ